MSQNQQNEPPTAPSGDEVGDSTESGINEKEYNKMTQCEDEEKEEVSALVDDGVGPPPPDDAVGPPPPDGGWGWLVVLGCTVGHVLIVGTSRSFGIFFVALVEKFNLSASQASIIPSIFNCGRMVFGPLVSWLCDRYTCRLVVMVGGFIYAAGCVASAYATGAVYLTISFGIVASLGAGFVFTPMFIILNQYFDKNKGKAMSFATLGSGVGTFIMATSVTFLLSEYGYSGAMLVVGGLVANNIVVGALFRPLPSQKKPEDAKVTLEMKSIEDDSDSVTIKEPSSCSQCKSTLKTRCSLITNITFLLYGFFIMALSFCVNLPLVLLPPLCKEYNMPNHRAKAAILVSTMSFSDMVGRFFFGFVFDLPRVRPVRRPFHSCLGLIMGVSVCLLAAMPNFWALFGMCIFWGFVESGYHSQRATIQSTFLPKEQVSNSLGFMTFFQGVGNLTSLSLAGVMADAFGTYRYCFVYGGCVMIVFAGAFLAEYYLRRIFNKS